jgi:hypothetical protein
VRAAPARRRGPERFLRVGGCLAISRALWGPATPRSACTPLHVRTPSASKHLPTSGIRPVAGNVVPTVPLCAWHRVRGGASRAGPVRGQRAGCAALRARRARHPAAAADLRARRTVGEKGAPRPLRRRGHALLTWRAQCASQRKSASPGGRTWFVPSTSARASPVFAPWTTSRSP